MTGRLRELTVRLLGLLRLRRRDDPLEELRFHREMLQADLEQHGLSREAARAEASRRMGGEIQTIETWRDQTSLPSVETLVQDARYGIRALRRTPGYTLAALVTLTLGIGANSAIFSVVNAVLLQPLPYREPDRILQMFRDSGGLQPRLDARRYEAFRHMQAFEALAAWRGTAFNLVAGSVAEHLSAVAVSREYFTVFGGTPLYGRTFEPHEDLPNGPDVVILGHDLWRRMFGADPGAVGTTVLLGERPFTVVGVMPAGFDRLQEAALYVPLKPSPVGPGGGFNYWAAGRLRHGVSAAQANAEADVLFRAVSASAGFDGSFLRNERAPQFLPYQESVAGPVRPALLLMLGAVGMLLLIACANTANLLLARASAREHEMSVRAALGAGRGRIIRQLVTESTVLFLSGGLLGVALAHWTVPALVALTPPGYLPSQNVTVDATVLAVTLVVSLVTGVLFGLAPAVSLSRQELASAFRGEATRSTSSRRAHWLRRTLVVSEVALCMVLLVGAGLLVRTFVALRSVDLGFEHEDVLVARMSLAGERYAAADATSGLFDRGLDRLRQIPGVQSAAAVNGIPIERGLNLNFDNPDTAEVEYHLTDWRYVTPDYFATMGITVVEGRGLTARDTRGAPRVAVVSRQFATRYYPGASPLGRRIVLDEADGPVEIVGVARDLREAGLSGEVPAVMYVPVAQAGDTAVSAAHLYFEVSWVIRASGRSPQLTERIREELRALEPRQPVTAVRSIHDVKARAMAAETFQMTLLGAFAAIGLLLAAAGVYGVMVYGVAQRTREFGIRLALGASRRGIVLRVLGQGVALAATGVAVGLAVAAGLTRTLEAVAGEMSAGDVWIVALVAAVLLLVAVAASLLPALRTVRLNPISALRES